MELQKEKSEKDLEQLRLLAEARINFKITAETQKRLLEVLTQMISSFSEANKEAEQIRWSLIDTEDNMGRMKIEFSNGKKMLNGTDEERKIARENIIDYMTYSFSYWKNIILNKRPHSFCFTSNL